MNDKFIRKYSHELPESVVSSCPEFAGAAAGSGRGAQGQRANGKWKSALAVIVPVSIAALVLAGVIAGLITASYMKHRRTDEPDITIIDQTPDTTAPAATEVVAPSILPTAAPTAEPTTVPTSAPTPEPTATPEPAATPEPTEAPTAIPTATPLYPEPEATKFYQFSGYDEIAGMLCESSYGIYQLLREDNKGEYGAQYARLLKLFADGTIRPAAPFADGERMRTSLIGYLYTNGTFNLPWIEYKCVTGETYEQYRYYDIRFTYLDLIEGHDLSRSSIAEVIAVLEPGIPLPSGNNVTKTAEYISECRKNGVEVLPPDVNRSYLGFTAEGSGIRFGLLAVRNLGRGFITGLLEERKNGEFKNLPDLCERMYGKELNRRTAEALIKSGALDGLGANRAQMLFGWEGLANAVDTERRSNAEGQTDLFGLSESEGSLGDFRFPEQEEFPLDEMLRMEKEMTGLYISGHPLESYSSAAKAAGASDIADYLPDSGYENGDDAAAETREKLNGEDACFVAVIQSKTTKTTKNGDMMAFVTLEDMTGSIEALLFPRVYEENRAVLVAGNVVTVEPGIYVPGVGGVRIEDCGIVTFAGFESFASSPRNLISI